MQSQNKTKKKKMVEREFAFLFCLLSSYNGENICILQKITLKFSLTFWGCEKMLFKSVGGKNFEGFFFLVISYRNWSWLPYSALGERGRYDNVEVSHHFSENQITKANRISRVTQSPLIASQNNAIGANYVKKKTDNTQYNRDCWLLRERWNI